MQLGKPGTLRKLRSETEIYDQSDRSSGGKVSKEFDLESVYDEKIAPLMTEIIRICKEHEIPMFATFVYKGDPEGTGDGEQKCCTTSVPFQDVRGTEELFMKLCRALQPEPSFVAAFTVNKAREQ